jgi:CDP-2,3-bis-(O-geranylgeranyl)-sn-glycerol synthase
MFAKGKHPIDGGRTWRGKPVLGPGKTWKGLAFGSLVGMLVATFQMFMFPLIPWGISDVGLDILPMTPFIGLVIGLGAMLGDIAGSLAKRRLGITRGKPAPLLDQLDFIAGMFLMLAIFYPLKWEWVIILLVMTPVLHLIANRIAYALKIRNVPY